VLDQFDGSAAHEEFADLIGIAYENYLKYKPGDTGRFWSSEGRGAQLESSATRASSATRSSISFHGGR